MHDRVPIICGSPDWDRVEKFVDEHSEGPWWLSVPPSGPQELKFPSANDPTVQQPIRDQEQPL